jgi:hypothetical protein
MAATGKQAQADSVEAPEKPAVNVPATTEEPKVEEDKQVQAKLRELDKVCKQLAKVDELRAQRKELIQNLQLMGAKNSKIREVTGLSNAGYLNAQKDK